MTQMTLSVKKVQLANTDNYFTQYTYVAALTKIYHVTVYIIVYRQIQGNMNVMTRLDMTDSDDMDDIDDPVMDGSGDTGEVDDMDDPEDACEDNDEDDQEGGVQA